MYTLRSTISNSYYYWRVLCFSAGKCNLQGRIFLKYFRSFVYITCQTANCLLVWGHTMGRLLALIKTGRVLPILELLIVDCYPSEADKSWCGFSWYTFKLVSIICVSLVEKWSHVLLSKTKSKVSVRVRTSEVQVKQRNWMDIEKNKKVVLNTDISNPDTAFSYNSKSVVITDTFGDLKFFKSNCVQVIQRFKKKCNWWAVLKDIFPPGSAQEILHPLHH